MTARPPLDPLLEMEVPGGILRFEHPMTQGEREQIRARVAAGTGLPPGVRHDALPRTAQASARRRWWRGLSRRLIR